VAEGARVRSWLGKNILWSINGPLGNLKVYNGMTNLMQDILI